MDTDENTVHCWIYKSLRKEEMYLYVTRADDFAAVPEALMHALGPVEQVMELDLSPDRPLAREDVVQVIAQLRDQGFFLQLPPKLVPELYAGD